MIYHPVQPAFACCSMHSCRYGCTGLPQDLLCHDVGVQCAVKEQA